MIIAINLCMKVNNVQLIHIPYFNEIYIKKGKIFILNTFDH